MKRQVEQAQRDRDTAQRAQWQTNAGRIAALWGQCAPLVAGDPVALYLAHRLQSEVWPLPDCLRMHPALPYRIDGATVGTCAPNEPALREALATLKGQAKFEGEQAAVFVRMAKTEAGDRVCNSIVLPALSWP